MKIDAHHHFWDLSMFEHAWITSPQSPLEPLKRTLLPEHLAPLLAHHGISGSVLVQTFHSLDETEWFLRLADDQPWILGVVGWVDLTSPQLPEQLDRFTSHPKLVGIRHVVHDEPDPHWLTRPDVKSGLGELERRRIPFDLLLRPIHLQPALEIARSFPQLPLVIDHIAKPRIASASWDDWAPGFAALAQCPNVSCKLSGMITEAQWNQWKPDQFHRYIDYALDQFTPQRLMYGSDWPVCLLAGSYDDVISVVKPRIDKLSASEQASVWAETAIRFYQLKYGTRAHPFAALHPTPEPNPISAG